MSITQNINHLREEIAERCASAGRNADSVRLLAVSKTVDLPQVQEAIEAGQLAFGENRPDELVRKQAAFPQAEWHFIGNIQSRRIKDIVPAATLIHSVFKPEHFAKIDAAAKEAGKVQDILLEVNVSGEESKSGLEPDAVLDALVASQNFDSLRICGLMTMAPQGSAEAAQKCFSDLRQLRDELETHWIESGSSHLHELSMGMSEDWGLGIDAGSTIIRIGRAVFSDDFAE